MMTLGGSLSSVTPAAAPAHIRMSDKDKDSMKGRWNPAEGTGVRGLPVLFKPEEVDIYCNKVTLDTYIFHGKKVDYEGIDYLEYDPKEYTVDVVLKNGARMDLGVRIQWLVRPYFSKAQEAQIVQTKDGQSIDGVMVPLKHRGK